MENIINNAIKKCDIKTMHKQTGIGYVRLINVFSTQNSYKKLLKELAAQKTIKIEIENKNIIIYF